MSQAYQRAKEVARQRFERVVAMSVIHPNPREIQQAGFNTAVIVLAAENKPPRTHRHLATFWRRRAEQLLSC